MLCRSTAASQQQRMPLFWTTQGTTQQQKMKNNKQAEQELAELRRICAEANRLSEQLDSKRCNLRIPQGSVGLLLPTAFIVGKITTTEDALSSS